MTKEELEKEARINLKRRFGEFFPQLTISYVMGAEPREKQIVELEKENAELKSRDCWKDCEYANPKSELIAQHIKDVQQLTKAKELIEDFICYANLDDCNLYIKEQAEQFLKETK